MRLSVLLLTLVHDRVEHINELKKKKKRVIDRVVAGMQPLPQRASNLSINFEKCMARVVSRHFQAFTAKKK